jgi:tetratricopeptide (TPR) repeat protein
VQAQRQLNDYAAAEATARRLIAADPGGAAGPYALAQVYEQRHEPRKVVETLQPVVDRLTPATAAERGIDVTALLLHLGFAYIDLDQPDRALAVLQRAKQGAADSATVDVGLVQAQLAAGQVGQAAETAAKARARHPDEVRLARIEAEALRQAGQMDRGVAVLEQVRQAHPDDPSNYVALAQLLLSGDRAVQAAAVMEDARARFPDDVSVLFETGAVYDRQKKFAEAEKSFNDVLARDPRHSQALNYLGYMLADRGVRLDESIKYIRRALEVEPNNPAYLDSLGWAYFKMNRLDLAEQNLRQAAADRPRDSAVQDHWGDLLLKLGRPTEAVAAWKRALAGDGQDIDRPAIDGKIRSTSGKTRK